MFYQSKNLFDILFAASSLGTACYYMIKRNVNVAYLSVGVDYFQVLAMFAGSKTRWPPLIRKIMLWFSMFNLNLDLAAPECVFPEVTFELKWSLTMSVPVGCVAMMLFVNAARWLTQRLRGRRVSLRTALAAVVAIIIAGYFGINPPGFVAQVVAFARERSGIAGKWGPEQVAFERPETRIEAPSAIVATRLAASSAGRGLCCWLLLYYLSTYLVRTFSFIHSFIRNLCACR